MVSISIESISDSLRSVGLGAGDTVFVHSDLKKFGFTRDANGRIGLAVSAQDLHRALSEVLGERGTIVVPTFSYTRDEVFSLEHTPSATGIFSEYIRTRPEALRSHHPLISVTALGANAVDLVSNVGESGFGANSPYERMHKMNAQLLLICVPFCSLKDYVETLCRVPYRYEKRFSGMIEEAGQWYEIHYTHFVRYRTDDKEVTLIPFLTGLNPEERACIRSAELGSDAIHCVTAQEAYSLLQEILTVDPYRFVADTFCDFGVFEFLRDVNGYTSSAGWRLECSIKQMGKEEEWRWIISTPTVEVRKALGVDDANSITITARGAESCIDAASSGAEVSDKGVLSFLSALIRNPHGLVL